MGHVLAISDSAADRLVLFIGEDGEQLALGTLQTVFRLTDRPPLYPEDLLDEDSWHACNDVLPRLNETIEASENR